MDMKANNVSLFGSASGFKAQPATVNQVKPVAAKKTPEVPLGGNPFAATVSNSNMFSDSTVGLTKAKGPVYAPASAGKSAGLLGSDLNTYC